MEKNIKKLKMKNKVIIILLNLISFEKIAEKFEIK